MSNNAKLTKEEKTLLEDFEAGKFKRVRGAGQEKNRYQQIAKHTLRKSRNISIRLTERDLRRIRALAAEKGLPYQTFIASLLHQHANEKMKKSA